jgi:chromosome segregation ATPase
MEFGSKGGGSGRRDDTTTGGTSTSPSWKTQVFQLKQEHYEEKLLYEKKIDDHKQKIVSLQKQILQYQKENETNRTMLKTLEETLQGHDVHRQELVRKLDQAEHARKQIDEQLKTFKEAVEEGKAAVETERSTSTELIQQLQLERDRILRKVGEEEAGRLRAERQVADLQKKIQSLQQRIEDDRTNNVQTTVHLQNEIELTKRTYEEKINLLNSIITNQKEQLEKQETKKTVSEEENKDANDNTKNAIKVLQVKINRLVEANETLKSDVERQKAKHNSDLKDEKNTSIRYKNLYEEAEASRKKLADQIKKMIKERKAQTSAGTTKELINEADNNMEDISNPVTSIDYLQITKEINALQKSLAHESNVVESLLAQISVMEKAQPSKKVKDGLAEKKKLVKEKQDNCIKILESVVRLHTQQLDEIYKQSDEATKKLEIVRKEWWTSEQELTTASSSSDGTTNNHADLTAKADAAAMRFSTARQDMQRIKEDLESTLRKLSDSRSRIADLTNSDIPPIAGDSADSSEAVAEKSAGASMLNTNACKQKLPTPAPRRQSKRQKTIKEF